MIDSTYIPAFSMSKFLRLKCSYTILLVLSLFVTNYTISLAQTDSIDAIVKQFIDKEHITGLSVAIIQNGAPIWNKGYGLANVEHRVHANDHTVFRLASISKQFFATAILKLVQDGKLSLDDGISSFFRKSPDIWQPIKIKHLLSHTSGLAREAPGYDNFKLQSDISIVQSAYELPLEFPTGQKYQYCNLGYYMLAEIISQVSGKPWQDYIQTELFDIAGMKDTYLTDFYPTIPNRANGYVVNNGSVLNATPMISIRPSGGFLSTTSDMIKWDKILTDQKLILNQSNWTLLWQPFIKVNTNDTSNAYYGFGWTVDTYQGHKVINHGGSNMGFKTQYSRFVDDHLSIIVLTNTDHAKPNNLVLELANFLLKMSK
ncbi:MAG: serine hydrolase domain-containing protein [Saprospiraceae bacterium]